MTKLRIELQPKQHDCLNSEATEILYGGAAYGGKSYLLRAIAIILCNEVAGLQVYLFRRTHPDLVKNHLNGSGSFPEILAPMIATKQCDIKAEAEIRFENGSKIHLCHCQHEKDVLKYQGAEIHVLLMDELTHFTEYQYRFLRNRVRLGGLSIPKHLKEKLPLIVSASNPGGVGHQWVKATFVNYAPPFAIKRADDKEGGMLRQYIPARLNDNKIGMNNDPGYIKRLEGLGNESLVKAMKDGDWDIVAGAAFEKLSRDKHMIRTFEIPEYWTKFTCMDWGTAKPYSIGWYTVVDDTLELKAKGDWPTRLIAKGSIIRYRELYGYGGQPDVGTREESWEVARKMVALEDENIDYRIADSAMWAEHDGPSAAENFMKELARLKVDKKTTNPTSMEKSRKDRVANYLELRNRFAAIEGEQSGLYIWPTCEHFWRTVPDLQLDERDPEKGWDTDQEDHVIDECGYAIVSRPKLWTFKERDLVAYDKARKKAFEADRKGNTGRYS
jgi:hypothetical protein